MNRLVDPALAYFPPDYFTARTQFRAFAQKCGAKIANYPISACGPGGEPLYVDTAYLGSDEPQRLLVLCSGTHGIEGFAGSALQQQWLDRDTPLSLPQDGGCLLIHALNPYGFAWIRRVNENNVDLNRNALRVFPGPSNLAYRRLESWLNPPSPPGRVDLVYLQNLALLLRYGFASLQQAIVEGQYEFPRGIFYGGDRPQESIKILFNLLAESRWRNVKHVIVIDIHTGVGRRGTFTLMVDETEDSLPYRNLTQWFGAENVISNQPAGSLAYRVSGGLTERLLQTFPNAATYAAVLEFGTVPALRMLATLQRENRACHFGQPDSDVCKRHRAALMDVFCPHDPQWRHAILRQGEEVLRNAERACFTSPHDANVRAPAQAK